MSGIFCEYCEEELSEEKGELAHGCLRCHYDPRVDKIKHLEAQLKEASEVIGFYGDPKSWLYPGNDFHDFQIAKEDIGEVAWTAKSGRVMRGRKAGKRAREYMKKYQEKA